MKEFCLSPTKFCRSCSGLTIRSMFSLSNRLRKSKTKIFIHINSQRYLHMSVYTLWTGMCVCICLCIIFRNEHTGTRGDIYEILCLPALVRSWHKYAIYQQARPCFQNPDQAIELDEPCSSRYETANLSKANINPVQSLAVLLIPYPYIVNFQKRQVQKEETS